MSNMAANIEKIPHFCMLYFVFFIQCNITAIITALCACDAKCRNFKKNLRKAAKRLAEVKNYYCYEKLIDRL